MALVIKDRVLETSTTTGTGTLTLAGATTGYQSFSTAIGNTNTTYYTISTPTGSEWEVGLGTVGAGTLARTTVLASSNGGSAVNFSAGVKDVFGTYPADKAVASTGALTSGRVAYATTDGAVTDSANFTFNGTTLTTANDASISGLTVGKGIGAVATNTAIGFQAINATATGGFNVSVGYQALFSVTSGSENTSVGQSALKLVTSGGSNTAIGSNALSSITTTSSNTAIGRNSQLAATGSNNTSVGSFALYYGSGVDNIAIGTQALNGAVGSTGASNVAIGRDSQANYFSGSSNVSVGATSLNQNTTGNFNVAIGRQALQNNTTAVATLGAVTGGSGYTNGTYTGVVMTLSSGSTATTYPTATIVVAGGAVTTVTITSAGVGFKDTTTVLTAPAASIGGTGSGFTVPVATLATGGNNTAVGYQALTANTTASSLTAIGYQALKANTTGTQNTAVGTNSLNVNSTGINNTAVGFSALAAVTTGTANVGVGNRALLATTGSNNTGVGNQVLYTNSTGASNTAVGQNALFTNNGSNNTGIGNDVGFYLSSGTQNTLIGNAAGASGTNNLTTGSNNIIIGYNAAASSATVSNEVTIGNDSITSTRLKGNVGIGNTPSGSYALEVTGKVNTTADVSIRSTTYSVLDLQSTNAGSTARVMNNQDAGGYLYIASSISATAKPIAFNVSSSLEAMRISSAGGVSINNTTNPGAGNLSVTGNILSNGATGAIGYATGSGGAVTQATSRTTGVTLNKTNGAITLVSAAGLATYQSFTVTNSTVAATDTIIVNQKSGTDKNIILVTNVAAGSFQITFATTGGTTTEQPVFNFAVIKAVTA